MPARAGLVLLQRGDDVGRLLSADFRHVVHPGMPWQPVHMEFLFLPASALPVTVCADAADAATPNTTPAAATAVRKRMDIKGLDCLAVVNRPHSSGSTGPPQHSLNERARSRPARALLGPRERSC